MVECFHPDAKDLFDHTSNLFKVAVYLHDVDKRLHVSFLYKCMFYM
jgi:hypothetical protein